MDPAPFWGPVELEVGESWTRPIGRSELTLEHDSCEWRATTRSTSNPPTSETATTLRIATRSSDRQLILRPRLADRPVVARLEVPLRIAPGDGTTIYVGSPLSVSIELAPPEGKPVGELPLFSVPSTWFGPSPRRGELCYASRTIGRLRPEAIEHFGDRAITTVVVENTSSEPLLFERVRIPVPLLSLYVDATGKLWTNRVTVTISDSGVVHEEEIEAGPPTALDVGDLERLAAPRETEAVNLFARAFGALL